jgi:hypothetical protein
MTIAELRAACEGREFLQLTSPDSKRPIPHVLAELLCASPHNKQSVWLYKTKSILRYLDREEAETAALRKWVAEHTEPNAKKTWTRGRPRTHMDPFY